MEENWCSLAICIIVTCTPEQAFAMYADGKRHQVKLDSIDLKAIERYKELGLTWKQIGDLFGLQESTVFKRFKRYSAGRVAV